MTKTNAHTPKWLAYERCAAVFTAENFSGLDSTVVPNARIIGKISGKPRQVDVLVDARLTRGVASRIIVDAKRRRRKVGIEDVEAFEGMMRDCCATHGILVTPTGHTDGAKRRAQDGITIVILEAESIADYEFGLQPCLNRTCRGRMGRGAVLWEAHLATGFDGMWVMLQVGKCDACRSFHVWCWDCGGRFAIPDGKVVMCDCGGREWASVRESAASGHVGTPTSTWLMARHGGGSPMAIDRKPISQ